MLHLLERRLTFKPNAEDHGGLTGIPHTRLTLGHEFGLELDAAFVPGTATSVVLFLHGNRHNLTHFRDHYRLFLEHGLPFLAFDYPGYGRSAGVPSEEGLYAGARAAYTHLIQHYGYTPAQVAVYGLSMGGAVSIELLLSAPAACLITESTFTCSWEMARHLYPLLPIWRLFPNRFNNLERIERLRTPLLMVHAEDDQSVPCEMGRRLYARAKTAEQLITVPGAQHVTTIPTGGAALSARIAEFIHRHTGATNTPA